jgi:alkylation response protein AidB-like acyl-CoA dehydrogenase
MRELAGDITFLEKDQLELRRIVRTFLGRHLDEASVRRQVETPERFDRSTWDRMTAELGLPALAVPEDRGGIRATALEVVVVAEELGAVLAPQPFLPAVLAAAGLVALDNASTDSLLEGIVGGEIVAVVPPRTAVGHPGGGQELRVEGTGAARRLRGQAYFVVNGAQADRFLVYVDAPDGPVLLTFGTGERVRVEELPCLDGTRPQASLIVDDVPVTVLASGAPVAGAWARAQRWGILALAAGEVGVARRCLEMSVEYAGVREQFGRLIGSQQSIKHHCTDMLIALDLARAAVRDAAIAVRDERSDADAAAHQARYLAQRAAEVATRDCIEVHGGIGFTWEHPAHLYYKRARADASLLGSSTDQLDAFGALTLQPPSGSRT